MGASRGDNRVVIGLANREHAVCRVAGLGGLPSGISRSIGPQRTRWTTSFFSTSPAGSARAIGPGKRASRPPPKEEITTSDVGDLSLCLPYRT
jgi:hypothetical protein